MTERSVLAVDVGGTKMAGGVVGESGEIRGYRKIGAPRSPGDVAAFLAADWGDGLDGVGVIVPGIYNPRSGKVWAPNLWGTDEVEMPLNGAAIASDRSGYVLGETWLGAAQGLRDVVFLGVGTGIGAGILCDGRVVEGAGGIAGAVGWMCLRDEFEPAYAVTGCWETEAAGPAVARKAGLTNAEMAAELARSGDTEAQQAWAEAARYLGMGVANLISTLNPEMVVLGGGLAGAADLLMDGIRKEAARWAQPVAFRNTKITVTALGERAGLLGAARLAFQRMESEN